MADQPAEHPITMPARLGLLLRPPARTPAHVRRVCRWFFGGWLMMVLAGPGLALGSAWLPDRLGPVTLALLPIGLLGLVIAALAYRAHTRLVRVAPAIDGVRCAHCGYDTSGLGGAGACPECGQRYERLSDQPPA